MYNHMHFSVKHVLNRFAKLGGPHISWIKGSVGNSTPEKGNWPELGHANMKQT